MGYVERGASALPGYESPGDPEDLRAQSESGPDSPLASTHTGVVTLLFTDIVASTELLDRLGDDAWEELRRSHFGLLCDAVTAAGGTAVKNLGDGLMAVFASGIDAMECAVEIQQAVARHNRRAGNRRFKIRVGLHAGEPRRDRGDYFGTPVVIARRLCDAAEGGEILASRLVVDLIGSRGDYGVVEVGPLTLKGLAAPVAACRVAWTERARLPFPSAMASLREAQFVGRDQEFADLKAAWNDAQTTIRTVVFLAGEPGIGKTTLAVRLAEEAWEQGALVLFGRCDEESHIPFQPFVEAIAHYVENASVDDLRRHLGSQASDLCLLFPSLSRRLPELADVSSTGAETERYRIFESVTSLLSAVGSEMPVVLVLDDLHWADRPTLGLLRHVIRRSESVPLLVLGTYRDTDLIRTHPMAEALADLRRAQVVTRISVRGLRARDVVAMVVGDAHPDPTDLALADTLWRETEGSPLFLREILRHLSETGTIVRMADGRWRTRRRVPQLGIPDGIKEVIGRRLTRLSDDANAVLLAASVVGREFSCDLVGLLTNLSVDKVLDVLDESTAAGIVTELGHQPGRYSFTHALVRQALYGDLSLTRRVLWHQRVGEAIEALHSEDLTGYLAELAHHFTQAAAAGHAEKAIEYCRRAGELNMAKVAYEEAARYFSMALDVAEETGSSNVLLGPLLLAKGDAQWRAGDPSARATFTGAASLARAHDDPTILARAALGYAGAAIRPVWVEIAVVNDEAVALLEEALGAIGRGDDELHALLLATLARELYWSPGTRRRRENLLSEAVAMARRLGDARTLAYVLANGCLASMGPDTTHQRQSDAQEIITIARELGDTPLHLTGQGHLAVTALELGDIRETKRLWAEFGPMVKQVKDPILIQITLLFEAVLAEGEGRFDDADARRAQAFQYGQEAHDRNVLIQFLVGNALWLRRLGRSGEGIGPGRIAIGIYPLSSASIQATLITHYLDLGDRNTVRRLVDEVDPTDPGFLCGDLAWLYTVCCLAEGIAFLGDQVRSRQLYDLLLPYQHAFVAVGYAALVGPVAGYLAVLASAFGLHDLAIAHGREGLQRARDTGSEILATESQMKLATVLLGRGEPDDVHAALDLASQIRASAVTFGMPGLAEQADAAIEKARGREVPRPGAALVAPSRIDRGRSRLTSGARSLVGWLSRDHDDDELIRRFGSPLAQRALFAAMAKSFQPSTAFGFQGEVLFEIRLPGDGLDPLPPDWWTIEVRGRKATARLQRTTDAAATIQTNLSDLIRLLSGELHPMRAVVEGRVHIDGDVLVAGRIPEMFGGFEGLDGHGRRRAGQPRATKADDSDAVILRIPEK